MLQTLPTPPIRPISRPARDARLASAILPTLLLAGCVEKTQYIYRPAVFAEAAGRPHEETMTLADGTKVVISDKRHSDEEEDPSRHFQFSRVEILDETDDQRKAREKKEAEEGIKELKMREETSEGKVIIRAFTPEQVLSHLMTCLRNEEYDVLYEQLLDPTTQERWKKEGGIQAWRDFCIANRGDLMSTCNRMSFSLLGGDVVLEKTGANVIRARFSPRLAQQFKFHTIEMDYTRDGMKLLSIRS